MDAESAWLLDDAGRVLFSTEPSARLPPFLRGELARLLGGAARELVVEGGRARVLVEHRGPRRLVVFRRADDALERLSARQIEIAELAAAGATSREIASSLAISSHTVRQHLKDVYRLLGIGCRVELARALVAL